MKRVFILLMAVLLVTGCNSTIANVSKVESTIYKTYNHTEQDINEVFSVLQQYFLEEGNFYDCTLLTIEYGKYQDTTGVEEEIKMQNNAVDAMYLTFTFKTGTQTQNLTQNSTYEYHAWAVKIGTNWEIINIGQG